MYFVALILVVAPLFVSTTENDNNCIVMCLFKPNHKTEPAGRLTVDRLPSNLACTDFVYGMATINAKHEVVEGIEGDKPSLTDEGNYNKLNRLRYSNPSLRILLGVTAGEDANEKEPLQFLSNPYTRKTFIDSIHKHLREYDFNGVFLDISPDEAKWQYVQLLKEMSTRFAEESALTKQPILRIVVVLRSNHLDACATLMKGIVQHADYVYLMTDVPDNEGKKAAYQDALYPSAPRAMQNQTISIAARRAVQIGVPMKKLIIGFSLWARSYTLVDTRYDRAGSDTKGPGTEGPITKIPGRLAYFEVCDLRDAHLARTPYNDDETLATSIVINRNQWISYNTDSEVFRRKISFAGAAGYAGVGLDSLDADDHIGTCKEGIMPLLNATARALSCYKPPPRNVNTNKTSSSSPMETRSSVLSACVRMCYYRPSKDVKDFSFDTIQGQWCSHMVIGPVDFKVDGSVNLSPHVSLGKRLFDSWNPRMATKPKLILSVGAHQTADEWRQLVSSEMAVNALVESIVELMGDSGAEGVDIMWMQGMDNYQTGLTRLIHELRKMMDGGSEERMLALSILPNSAINNYYDFAAIKDQVDIFNILGHLFHTADSSTSGHHATLFAGQSLEDPRMSMEAIASLLLAEGVNASQIVVGVTAEAMVQTLNRGDASATPRVGLRTTGPGRPAKTTHTAGTAAYYEVWGAVSSPGARLQWLGKLGVPVAIVDDQFYAYDNAESVALKARWSSLRGFGGVSLWGLEYDDPWGLCPGGWRFPLLQAMFQNQICSRCLKPRPNPSEECDAHWAIRCEYNLIPSMTGKYLSPESLPWHNCTHLVIRDVSLSADGNITVVGRGQSTSDYERARNIRKADNSTKLIVSVTCDMDKETFAVAVKRTELRNKVIRALVDLVKIDQLDGIELDCDHVMHDVKQEMAIILTQVKNLIRQPPIETKCPPTLGLRVPGWRMVLDEVYDMMAVGLSVDNVILEGYRYSSEFDARVKAHSPLYAGYTIGQLSVHKTVEAWKKLMAGEKIIVMLPGYPALCHLEDPESSDIGALSNTGNRTQENIFMTYAQLCESIMKGEMKRGMSIPQIANFAHGISNHWIAYETPNTVSYKVDYAYKYNLGGVGISALNDEDSMGVCQLGYYPLLTAAQNTCH